MHTLSGAREGDRRREPGQIIVLFALSLVAILAMVGLVLDGGSAYASRRSQQSAADLAALSGANAYLVNIDQTASIAQNSARAAALATAAQNGYADGTGGVTINVSFATTNGAEVTVDIQAPHQNTFANVVGMPTWQISTTATAQTGFADTALAAAPFIFNVDVFQDPSGDPKPIYSDPDHPFSFGDGNGDVPNDPNDIAWTCYGTCGNVDSNVVRGMTDGSEPVNVTLESGADFNTYIGQHNNGSHTTLYPVVQDNLAGQDVAVPIVDDNGIFQGWATFHVVSATGGSTKVITGYFVSTFETSLLTISCPVGGCPRSFGSPVLHLVN